MSRAWFRTIDKLSGWLPIWQRHMTHRPFQGAPQTAHNAEANGFESVVLRLGLPPALSSVHPFPFFLPSQLEDLSHRLPFPPDVFRPVFLPSAPQWPLTLSVVVEINTPLTYVMTESFHSTIRE